MRAIVVLNAAAGVRRREEADEIVRISAAFAAAGVAAEVRPTPGPGLTEAARAAASSADVVVMGGGDGTMNAGAAALAGGATPMGVLPLGTLNHFAKDLGVPLELEDAARTVATGQSRAVDLGTANERFFVNNSSMGIYPRVVQDRETLRKWGGLGKWPAMVVAAFHTLRHFPRVRVVIESAKGELRLGTPMVFVGNNHYDMSLFALGKRDRLDEGQLWLYVARDTGRFGFVRLAARALVGGLDQSRDFLAEGLSELTVRDRRGGMMVALDGEVFRMESPIVYGIRPRALRVIAPAPLPP